MLDWFCLLDNHTIVVFVTQDQFLIKVADSRLTNNELYQDKAFDKLWKDSLSKQTTTSIYIYIMRHPFPFFLEENWIYILTSYIGKQHHTFLFNEDINSLLVITNIIL